MRLPARLEDLKNELGNSDKVLVDPESGERFIYVGADKNADNPNAIIAFSPWGQNGRAVLFGDGSVQQMSSVQFAEAEAREAAGVAFNAATMNAPAATHVLDDSSAPPAAIQRFGSGGMLGAMIGSSGAIGGGVPMAANPVAVAGTPADSRPARGGRPAFHPY